MKEIITFNKWHARIPRDGKYKSLGYFTEKEDALRARLIAQRQEGFSENHGAR